MKKILKGYLVEQVLKSLGPREFPGSVLFGSTSDAIPNTDKCEVDPHRHHYYMDKNSKLGHTDKAGIDGHMHLVINGEILAGNHHHTLEEPQGSCQSFDFIEDQTGITMPVFQTELSKDK
jgi:hypothetical protein